MWTISFAFHQNIEFNFLYIYFRDKRQHHNHHQQHHPQNNYGGSQSTAQSNSHNNYLNPQGFGGSNFANAGAQGM